MGGLVVVQGVRRDRRFQEGNVEDVVYEPQGVGESQLASVCRDDLGNRGGA